MSIRVKLFTALAISILALAAVVGCGSGDGDVPSDTPAISDEDPVQILQPGGVFTVDDVVAAGWKNSKELSPETLADAMSVWYGFYNQRDVEVRVYESHELALNSGKPPADEATGRGKPAPFAVGGISATRTSYTTYAIVGNLILLCEVKIEDCQGLLDGIE
ncbi:MAG: DUF6810 family protein [Dehalococcoidia bacterium]